MSNTDCLKVIEEALKAAHRWTDAAFANDWTPGRYTMLKAALDHAKFFADQIAFNEHVEQLQRNDEALHHSRIELEEVRL